MPLFTEGCEDCAYAEKMMNLSPLAHGYLRIHGGHAHVATVPEPVAEDGVLTPMSGWSEERIAAWVCRLCLDFGTTVATAHRVAAVFVEGLARDREVREVAP